MIPRDVARVLLIGYAGLAIMAARGFQLRAAAHVEKLWPPAWGWGFLLLAVVLLCYAVAVTSRVLCLTAGFGLHVLVAGRIWATSANQSLAPVVVPGAALAATAFYGVVLLSSALVWRYLLWPLTDHRS